MSNYILVTGAAGKVGSAVVKALLAKGDRVRAGYRNPSTASVPAGVEPVAFDFTNLDSVCAALDGVTGTYLISPPLDPDARAKLAPFIAEAVKRKIHIVFLSAFGANLADTPLRQVEQLLAESKAVYTILRPNFFMENFTEGWIAPTIKGMNAIYLPASDGKSSFIAVADIAAAVAASFDRKWMGQAFNLTGPEAFDHATVAQIISAATGRRIEYHATDEESTVQGARAMGMPEGEIEYLLNLYRAVRAGYAAPITGDVEILTGRKSITFSEFVEAHKSDW